MLPPSPPATTLPPAVSTPGAASIFGDIEPSVFTSTAFNAVGTVVSEDEPVVLDPLTGHLFYGTALGVRVLVPVR